MINILYSAIKGCRVYILSIFIIYCISCLIGIIMVHNGNAFALSFRDKIVGRAMQTDNAAINYQKGNNFSAALTDFYENLLFGALAQTLAGFSIVIPFVTVPVQGWIGGIVSVDYKHRSRLTKFNSSFYYFSQVSEQF